MWLRRDEQTGAHKATEHQRANVGLQASMAVGMKRPRDLRNVIELELSGLRDG